MVPVRCCGTTTNGSRCSLTSSSNLVNNRGISVAEPLRRGGKLCLFHARPFCSQAAQIQQAVVIFLDFENTGLDVHRDRIVEIGAASANGSFATVVCPGVAVMGGAACWGGRAHSKKLGRVNIRRVLVTKFDSIEFSGPTLSRKHK